MANVNRFALRRRNVMQQGPIRAARSHDQADDATRISERLSPRCIRNEAPASSHLSVESITTARKGSGSKGGVALSFGFLRPLKRPGSAPISPQRRKQPATVTN